VAVKVQDADLKDMVEHLRQKGFGLQPDAR